MTVEIITAFGMLVVYPICLFGFFAFLIWRLTR